MAKTYREVSDLAEQTVHDVTESPYAWMTYLDTASRMYRYTFQEQLLIHAQKPDATACASYSLWNSRFNRVVRRGTQGIALIDHTSQNPKLKYVFDVGDTVTRIGGKNPKLWKLPPVSEDIIVDRLAQRFDTQPENLVLDEYLHSLAADTIEGETYDAVEELKNRLSGSFLEGLDNDNLRVRFESLARSSLQYVLLSRCGIYAEDYFEPEDFQFITDFNTTDVLSLLGEAVADNANAILTAIGKISKQMEVEYQQGLLVHPQNLNQNPLDNTINSAYTLKHESEPHTPPDEKGGNDYGFESGIPRGSGWYVIPESDDSWGERGEDAGQVWTDASGVSDGTEVQPISGNATQRNMVGTPVGDRRESGGDGRTPDEADGGTGGRDRGAESQRSDGMGGSDEQHPEPSGGNGEERPDLPVTELEPASKPNIPENESDGTELSDFFVPSEAIDEVLRTGGNQRNGQYRIIAYHQLQGEDFPSMLREEFTEHGKRRSGCGIVLDGQRYAAWYMPEGIHIAKGDTYRNDNAELVTWDEAAERIDTLLRTGGYAVQNTVDRSVWNECLEIAAACYHYNEAHAMMHLGSDEPRRFFIDISMFSGGYNEATSRIAHALTDDPRFLKTVDKGLQEFCKVYENSPYLQKNLTIPPDRLQKRVENLWNEPRSYHTAPIKAPEPEYFITEDEIKAAIPHTTDRSYCKNLDVYSFFIHDHTPAEKAAFLKSLLEVDDFYTDYAAVIHNTDEISVYANKEGVRFSLGIPDEYADVTLSWEQYAERIQDLILDGGYLTQDAIDGIPDYEVDYLTAEIDKVFIENRLIAPPFNANAAPAERAAAIRELLTYPWGIDALNHALEVNLSATEEGKERHQILSDLQKLISGYTNGTLDLFVPSAKLETEAQKRGNSLTVRPSRSNEPIYVAEPKVEPAKNTELSSDSVPAEVVDEFLRTGGNQRYGALRVIAHHQLKGKDFPDMLRDEFLSYGKYEGGRGIALDSTKYSAWYGKDGIRVAKGSTVETNDSVLFSWEQVAARISFLLEHGLYQPQVVVDQAVQREYLECAEKMWNVLREQNREHEKGHPIFDIQEQINGGGYPEETAKLAELLKDEFFLRSTLVKLKDFCAAYAEDRSLLRFSYPQPRKVYERMLKLTHEPMVYPSAAIQPAEKEYFITNDEIDDAISGRQSNNQERNLKLYSFFIRNHTEKEQIDFLKDYFGTGGSSGGVSSAYDSWEDHSPKGMEYKRGEVKVFFRWNQYAKRLNELILSGRFLSQNAINQIPEYHKQHIIRQISHIFYRHRALSPFPYPEMQYYDSYKERDAIEAFLKEDGSLSKLEDAMLQVVSSLSPDDDQYEYLMQVYGEVSAYRQGTLDLFRPSPEMEEKANKNGISLVLHPFTEEERKNLVYLYKAGDTVFLDGKSYEIGELIGNSILLRDPDFPLFTETIERSEFEEKLKLDSRNAYLLGVPEPDIVVEQAVEAQDVVENAVEDVDNQTDVQSSSEPQEQAVPEDGIDPLHPYSVDYAPKGLNSAEPYAVVDERTGDYVTVGDEIQTFATEEEAQSFIAALEEELTEKQESQEQRAEEEADSAAEDEEEEEQDEKTPDLAPPDALLAFQQKYLQEIYDYAKTDSKDVYTYFMSKDNIMLGFHWTDDQFEIWQDNYLTTPIRIAFTIAELKELVEGFQLEPNKRTRGRKPSKAAQPKEDIPKTTISSGNESHSGVSDVSPAPKASEHTSNPLERKRPKPIDYRINDDLLGTGGAKEKFKRNLAAIQLVHKLADEGRRATAEEQKVLAQYVGWGGIPQAFDERNTQWTEERNALKAALSPEEYAAARGSTLNAHYTSPVVIREMYAGLERMGFTGGNILEPAMGTGNFFGMIPETLGKNSRLYGVELDEITGKIAKQLYQRADIQVKGFEQTDFSNDFFDVAIGNVPFGNYQVSDKQYDRHHLMIHDYFLAKSLDKVRPGGVVAVITSAGTLDKKDESARRYLAERANLLGAVRLPNNAFKANAGTEVVTDILFLQKRESPTAEIPSWVKLGKNEEGFGCNNYFAEHPEMVLGKWSRISTQFGKLEATIQPIEGADLGHQLREAIGRIEGKIELSIQEDEDLSDEVETIPADTHVRNFSYTTVNNEVYYRENSIMRKVKLPASTMERIKGMVALRDTTRKLINAQLHQSSDAEIVALQQQLNILYDQYTKKFGLISSAGNKRAFALDSSYCLLKSLEVLDDEGNLKRKADMFNKRTIKQAQVVEHVDTAPEALAVSIAEKAEVDVEYMAKLMDKSVEEILPDLRGIIFQDPVTEKWLPADEYLSGNVRQKLRIAEGFAENDERFAINVESLKKVQPKDLTASEIDIRLGATWLKPEYIRDFMRELLHTPPHLISRSIIKVMYSKITGSWTIMGKNADSSGNVYASSVYGTQYANAYRLLEDALNLRDTRILDRIYEDGVEKTVVNKKETMLAQQKQDAIRQQFQSWIFRDPQRRAELVKEYNERFNSIRPRQYDGSHITFSGMNPEINLREHQKNAVAHVLYGDNTLLAHCVGAGKTFEMVAAAMESKRLGLCNKSLFVVPNHLIEQWGAEFLQLYPGANILVATKKDFQPANRKAFCARIATGSYDAVIIGHSQFEKIPLSIERQKRQIQDQIDEIVDSIGEARSSNAANYTVKQLEKTRKSLQARLAKLNDQSRKDDVVCFEQLGVDRLFVDESHFYKNLFLYTKMRNVAGIAQTEAQKSSDMFAKCQYMDELTGGKGITFATGTPISNSMVEMYTLMRYLQYDTLKRMDLGTFDAWASTFGEKVTAIELSPEGTGYRSKTRFAKFFNLPELISVFKETADVKTSDMLKLPVPEAVYEDIVLEPSQIQQDMVAELGERAEDVRSNRVDPKTDNMLRITNDGRKLALDQRLINPMLPDNPDSKVNACVEKVFQIWQDGAEQRTTQLVFSDLSTPKGDGKFNVYDDLRDKLVAKGVPKEEIAFIHEADTEARKIALFAKVRSGQVRVLVGSTAKCGAGTNVQTKLIALHHLDVPWKPSDIEQQEGRIIRQGNENPQVQIYRYVTKNTFDSYSWQLLEQKQKFIGQIMTSKSPVRSADDVDEAALSFAEVKALASGNPLIREKMELDNDVARLKMIQASYQSQIYQMQDDISINYPTQIAELKAVIAALEQDQKTAEAIPVLTDKDGNEQIDITVVGKQFRDKKEAGLAIIAACAGLKEIKTGGDIGTYGGFTLSVTYDSCWNKFDLHIKGKASRKVEIGKDPNSNIRKIKAELALIPQYLENARLKLETVEQQLENAKIEVTKPFPQEAELNEKLERLSALNRELDNGVEVKASQVKTSDVIAGDDCDYVRKPSILGRLRKAQAAKRSQQPRVPQNQKKRDHSI